VCRLVGGENALGGGECLGGGDFGRGGGENALGGGDIARGGGDIARLPSGGLGGFIVTVAGCSISKPVADASLFSKIASCISTNTYLSIVTRFTLKIHYLCSSLCMYCLRLTS